MKAILCLRSSAFAGKAPHLPQTKIYKDYIYTVPDEISLKHAERAIELKWAEEAEPEETNVSGNLLETSAEQKLAIFMTLVEAIIADAERLPTLEEDVLNQGIASLEVPEGVTLDEDQQARLDEALDLLNAAFNPEPEFDLETATVEEMRDYVRANPEMDAVVNTSDNKPELKAAIAAYLADQENANV